MRLIGVGEDVAADERCRRVGGTQEGLSMENSTDPRAEANRKVRARDQPYEIPYELLGRWRADYSGQPSQLIHFTSPHSKPSTAARPLTAPSPLPSPHLTNPNYNTFTMDQLQISPETQQGLQNLSAKDKQELNQFIVGETQKAQVQSSTSRPPSLHECAFTRLAHVCL